MCPTKYRYLCFLIIMICQAFNVQSAQKQEEYFGEYLNELSVKIRLNASKRPTFILLNDFQFTDPNGLTWTTPKGWEVDGASIPQFAWSVVGGPMSGKYLYASIVHDRYCDTKSRTAHDTHRNFYYGMRASGVAERKAATMYLSVRAFGPSWKIVKQANGLGFIGPSTDQLTTVNVDAPKITIDTQEQIINSLDLTMSLQELDNFSDSIREKYGSEALQKSVPTIMKKPIIHQ